MAKKREIKVVHPATIETITGDVGWSVKPMISRKYAGSDKMWVAWVEFEANGKHDWHVHKKHDEALVVVDGEVDFFYKRGVEVIHERLKRGDGAFVPMSLRHKWENTGQPLTAIVAKAPSPPGAGR